MTLDHIQGSTWHKRLGGPDNAFRYRVDYLLADPDETSDGPRLFSRNRFNLMSLFTSDHGGKRAQGHGADWVRDVLDKSGIDSTDARILLLAQPRLLGTRFSPVSFWLVLKNNEDLIAVIAEVNNTFGQRHSYLCAHPDLRPIQPEDILQARKIFHVSPFQPVKGHYRFRFAIRPGSVSVRIEYDHDNGGLIATLSGTRQPLTNTSILQATFLRPFGSWRVLALIYLQATRLRLKNAPFRRKPAPPLQDVSH